MRKRFLLTLTVHSVLFVESIAISGSKKRIGEHYYLRLLYVPKWGLWAQKLQNNKRRILSLEEFRW